MATRAPRTRSDQRARIVDAARRLFAARGTDGVTMADVAAAAGVARATVFNHFGSKHALLEAITEEVIARYSELLQHALADTTTPTPALVRALFALIGGGIEEDRRFYRAVFRETTKIRLGLDEGGVGERAGREALALLVQLLARGQQRGELSTAHRAEDLASAFDSLVNGTITHWLYSNTAESLGRRMQRAAEVFLNPVAVGRGSRRDDVPALALPRRRRPARGGARQRLRQAIPPGKERTP